MIISVQNLSTEAVSSNTPMSDRHIDDVITKIQMDIQNHWMIL